MELNLLMIDLQVWSMEIMYNGAVSDYNYIINSTHPEFKNKVKLAWREDYFWDKRLVPKTH